ncbi:MAG: hypothetical protein Kow0089_00570 [Desulfobulbaceae bacterium]
MLALDTERLVLEYIHRAAAAGAVAANYLEVTSIDEAGDHYRVRMLDHRTGTGIRARSRFVVNAAGPWFAGSVFPGTDRERSRSWALAVNLVTPKQFFPGCGVALEGEQGYRDADALVKRDKRLFFFVPWRGHTMIGTLYEPWPHGPDRLRVEPAILQRMIDGINAIHPAARLGMNDISFYHAGLLPMRGGQADGGVQLEKESALVTPGEGEAKRLLSVRSVKYTTAPVVAREAVALLQRRLPPSVSPVPMEQTRSSDDREVPETLRLRYGPRAGRVGRYEEGEPDPWIDRRNGISRAEIRYLVAEEMAWRLEDIVFRRTGMGTAACPERETLSRAAACMGELLGWDAERRAGEVRRVLRRYAPLPCGDDGGKKEETR